MLLYQINPVGAQLFYVNTFSSNKFAIGRWIREYTSSICVSISNACINVDSEGGGGTPGICGAFDLCCLPHPWEFDWHLWVPGWGRLLFCMEEWDQVILSHVLVCALKHRPSWNWSSMALRALFLIEVNTYNNFILYKNSTSHYSIPL